MFLAVILAAALSGFGFSHLGVNEGLSQNSVLSIAQTPDGQMWLATYDGLNRFDGYDVCVYKHSDADSTSINSNLVYFLQVDGKGRLWVATNSGIDLYRSDTDDFRHLYLEEDLYITDMLEASPGHMLIGTNAGSYHIADNGDGSFRVEKFSPTIFRGACFCKSGDRIFISKRYSREIFAVDPGSREMTLLDFIPPVGNINDLEIVGEDNLWIASSGEGVYRVSLADSSVVRYTHSSDGTSLCSDMVRCIETDPLGNIWIGTGYNLSIYDPEADSFTTVESDELNPQGLSNSSIKSLYRSSDGGMWLGTFWGGANYYHSQRNRFETPPSSLPFRHCIVGGMACDGDGTLWIGTNRHGLHLYNTAAGKEKSVHLSDTPDKEDIKSIRFSPWSDDAYICTAFYGMMVLDRRSGHLQHVPYPDQVYDILEIDPDHAWICSMSGIFLYDTRSGHTRKVEVPGMKSLPAFTILRDGKGMFWVGAESGLVRCSLDIDGDGEPRCGNVTNFAPVSKVQDLFLAPDSTVWAACRGGLYRIREDRPERVGLDLPSNLLRSIAMDRAGMLWIGTDNGLCRYNPGSGAVNVYHVADGLPSNAFSQGSRLVLPDGRLVFGSLDGPVLFNPGRMDESNSTVGAGISKVVSSGRVVPPGRNGVLKLKHRQNTFSINFFAPDFVSWGQGRFQYRMEGWDPEWNEAYNTRTVTYTNLPGGRYRFLLKYQNSDGVPSGEVASMEIRVLRPWYACHLAVVIYALMLAGALGAAIMYLLRKREERTRREMDRVVLEKQAEIERLQKVSEENYRASMLLRFCQGRSISDQDYEFLSRACSIVMENLSNENWSVEALSDAMGLGRTRFHVRIKEITGESALQFIKKIRFEQACRMLSCPEFQISEIAQKVGFRTAAYFSTSFKAYTGVTPKQFQQNLKH